MANTYTQIHIQAVFAVQRRACLIDPPWQNELYSYLTGIVQQQGHKLLAINGMPDHIHVLFGMRPAQSLSDLLQDIKGDSSKWINEQRFTKERFAWQQGYGAFSYSKSQLPRVIRYIHNQQQHHQKLSFYEEYITLLKQHAVEYDERYLFAPID